MVRKNCALSEVLPTVWSLCWSLIYSIFSACQGFWIKVSTAPQKMKGVPGQGYVCVCLQLGPALLPFWRLSYTHVGDLERVATSLCILIQNILLSHEMNRKGGASDCT